MLEGNLITLRPWAASDLEFLGRMRNDVETQLSLMALPKPNSPRRVQEWLDRKSSAEDGLFFVIAVKADNRPVGFVEMREMKPIHGWGAMGIGLDRAARGKGYAKDALLTLEDYCRRTFGLRKIVLDVTAGNVAAVGLYEALGYERVGIHREHFFHDGKRHDVLIMEKRLTGDA